MGLISAYRIHRSSQKNTEDQKVSLGPKKLGKEWSRKELGTNMKEIGKKLGRNCEVNGMELMEKTIEIELGRNFEKTYTRNQGRSERDLTIYYIYTIKTSRQMTL